MTEKAGPKTINDEVQLLLRLCGEQGVLIRTALRRHKALKLPLPAIARTRLQRGGEARMLEESCTSTDARSPVVGVEHRPPG